MPASEGPRIFLPGSSEWHTWHFLNTSLPAAASPPLAELALGAGGACPLGAEAALAIVCSCDGGAGLGAAVWGLWLALTPHGTILFVAGLVTIVALAIYAASQAPFAKPVAVAIFDVVLPALLALPLVLVAWLQIAAGRWWLSLGRASRL